MPLHGPSGQSRLAACQGEDHLTRMLRRVLLAATLTFACTKPEPSTDPVIAFGDVEVVPVRQSGPVLEYPAVQREAGLEGRVEVEFVVKVDGTVDSTSLKIISSSNAAFEAPVRSALVATHYTPAQNGGKTVAVRLR